MKRLIIEQLKEGFLFIDENDEKYAVSAGSLSRKVQAFFGLTDHSKQKNIDKKPIAPPAKVSEGKPETQGNKTPDSHSGGATSTSLSTEQLQKQPDIKGINKGELDTSAETKALSQASPILNKTKLGTPDNIMQLSDLKLAAFEYSSDKMQQYKSLKFQELELCDGRVVMEYGNSKYYTSKNAVMQIPFPFPRGYFDKKNGWSSNVETAFKMYRRYLAEQKGHEGQPDGTCDDVSFETCANNDPKICKFCVNESQYEDKRKVAARKPGKPLLKASWGGVI